MPGLKKIKINKTLSRIGCIAEAKGLNSYLVGGAVRDLLTGKKDLDWDIVVEGNPLPLVKAAAKLVKGSYVSYPQFGTFSVEASSGANIDFATARKETYAKPGALPKVVFSSLEDDISRRDFTLNALAVSLKPGSAGEIIDMYGGKKDLENRVLRVLHNRSFKDDPTRIFRLARFAGRGYKIDKPTEMLAVSGASYVSYVSPSRLFRELILIIGEKNPFAALNILNEWKITGKLLPGVVVSTRLKQLSSLRTIDERMAFLLSGSEVEARMKIYASLRFPNKLKNSIEKLLEPVKAKPALSGKDLIKMGYKQGPRIGEILKSLTRSGIVSRAKAKKHVFDNFPQKI